MNSDIFSYCIIKLKPFPVIEEFVNIGVIGYDHNTEVIQFYLKKDPSRFNKFFYTLPDDFYSSFVESVERELLFVKQSSEKSNKGITLDIFRSFTKNIESMLQFSSPRTAYCKSAFKTDLKERFSEVVL